MTFSNLHQTIDIHIEGNPNVICSERKQQLGETKKPIQLTKSREFKNEDVDIDEKIHEENPYGDLFVNEEPLLDVDISYLGNIIEEKSENENDGFKKEYAVGSFFFFLIYFLIYFRVQYNLFKISSNVMYFIILLSS